MDIKEVIAACIEYSQEIQPKDRYIDYWTDECFEEYYYLPNAKPFMYRIKAVVWNMTHDKTYFSDPELKDFLYERQEGVKQG